jgi:23S rRNA (guanosine2251-2'-O)-methyltransferase
MARMRPKPNSTPDDIAFGINACAIALEQGLARSLTYYGDTRNRRVVELAEAARKAGIAVEAVPAERIDQLTGDAVHQGVLVRLRNLPTVGLVLLR